MSTVLLLAGAMVALQWTALTGALGAETRYSLTISPALESTMVEPSEQVARMRFREMDSNNDGVITREEWRGSARSFRVHDWNGDGILSGEEVRVGGRRDQEVDFDPTIQDEFWNWTEAGFSHLDHNRDGRISANEWHFNIETFRRADRNRDGVLSRAEFLGADMDDDRNDKFDDLDQNGNGRIERAEWHGSADAFDWLDRDGDNVLSRVEVVGTAPERTDSFASIDFNRNGVISPDEWHWSRASFDRLDLNRDGVLSHREYLTTSEGGATVSGQTVRVSGTERWVDTGLFVRAGDIMDFRAEGTMQLSDNPNDLAGPGGSRTGRLAPNAPIAHAPAGALLMRIGNSAPILVGDRGSIGRASVGGRVYLGVNDDHLRDNIGEYRVIISIRAQ